MAGKKKKKKEVVAQGMGTLEGFTAKLGRAIFKSDREVRKEKAARQVREAKATAQAKKDEEERKRGERTLARTGRSSMGKSR